MSNTPDFSVVIPVYNVAPYVRATIESVLRQTVTNIEVIAVNDGSTDGSLREMQKIQDVRLRIIDKENTGVSDTRNVGCRQAKGNYIAFLDADDYWYPDHLSEAWAFFQMHPDVHWCGARQLQIPIGTPPPARTSQRRFAVRNFFEDGKWAVDSSNLIIRRDLFSASGGYPKGQRQFEDHVFQSRIGRLCPRIGFNERETSIYYTRQGSASSHKPADMSSAYEAIMRVHVLALRELQVKTPLYSRLMMRELLKAALFYRSEGEVLALLDEFGFILPVSGLRRWRRFVKVAYWLRQHADIDAELRAFVETSLKGRIKKTLEILRPKGVWAAFMWACLIAGYALRGLGDEIENRRDQRAIHMETQRA